MGTMVHPVPGGVVTRVDDPQTAADERLHDNLSIDVAPPGSQTFGWPITAPEAGEIVFADWISGYGLTIKVQNKDRRWQFSHCSDLLVPMGFIVPRGHPIARLGNTGSSRGVHVHVKVRDLKSGLLIDPRPHFVYA